MCIRQDEETRVCLECNEDLPIPAFRRPRVGKRENARKQSKPWAKVCYDCFKQQRQTPRPFLQHWLTTLNCDKKRHDNIDLDVDFLLRLLASQNGECALTGVPLTFNRYSANKHRWLNPTNCSVDRIDNSKPYSQDNVRLVACIVNIMRGSLSDDELIKWCNRLIKGRT